MSDFTASSLAPIPAMQGILTAPDPEALQAAMRDLNACLATQPVSVIRDKSAQFRDLVTLHLMDHVRVRLNAVPEEVRSLYSTALVDYDALCRPVFPICSPVTRHGSWPWTISPWYSCRSMPVSATLFRPACRLCRKRSGKPCPAVRPNARQIC